MLISKFKTALAGAILALAFVGGPAQAAPMTAVGDTVRSVAAESSSQVQKVGHRHRHWHRHNHWRHRHLHRRHWHGHRSHRRCGWVRRCGYNGCRIVRHCHRRW